VLGSLARAPAVLVCACRLRGAVFPPVTIRRAGAPDVLDFLEPAIGIMPSREKTQSSGASIFGVGRLRENLR
jgi:hypothetical protein